MTTGLKSLLLPCLLLAATACPPPTPACSPQSCANGCCSADGVCQTAGDAHACGLNGATCEVCGGACTDGTCTGSGGGAAAGGGTATGGGTGSGGGTATGGGTAAGGGTGGTTTDGGCDTTPHDPALGTLQLGGGAQVTQYAALPAGVVAVGASGGTLYGLATDRQVHRLGTLPTLTLGPALARVTTPADDAADAGVYLGGSVAISGSRLAAGYTRAGAGFPGALVLLDLADGGVTWVDAPGNYTLAAVPQGFLVNGGGLGGATGTGVYLLEASDGGSDGFLLARFDPAWSASSGYTAATPGGTLALGYFDGTSFDNVVRGVSPGLWHPAAAARTGFSLAEGPVLASTEVAGVATAGEQLVLVRGGYLSAPPFSAYTSRVELLPLAPAGAGLDAGAPTTVLTAVDACTRVLFAVSAGPRVLLGLKDRNGRRLVELQP